MIDPAIIAEIKRLLAEEMPQREIARRSHASGDWWPPLQSESGRDHEQARRSKQEMFPLPSGEPCLYDLPHRGTDVLCCLSQQIVLVVCGVRQGFSSGSKTAIEVAGGAAIMVE